MTLGAALSGPSTQRSENILSMDIALQYVPVPPYAALLSSEKSGVDGEDNVPLANPVSGGSRLDPSLLDDSKLAASGSSPTLSHKSSFSGSFNLSNALISSAFQFPNNTMPSAPSLRGSTNALLSTRDPFALQLMTSNFRRFASRVRFVFWLTDRIEEVVMWRKSWKHTAAFIAAYAAVCYQPRLILVLPNVVALSLMLSVHQAPPVVSPSAATHTSIADPSVSADSPLPTPNPITEGSTAWFSNVQGIQNHMGAVADAHDAAMLVIPHLTWRTRASMPIFMFLLFTTLPLLLLPLRLTVFVAGVVPLIVTHPFIRQLLFAPDGGLRQSNVIPIVSSRLQRVINDVSLSEKHIESRQLREIELFQNERWAWPSSSATSAANGNVIVAGWKNGDSNLRPTERRAWTRERDGSQAIGDDSAHLKIRLEPSWEYVETEDWTPDYLGRWAPLSGTDQDGWVYTNDAWLDPHATPLEEWQKPGMTRRRRWTRRIYRTM